MKENLLIFIDFVRKLYNTHYMIKTMVVRELKSRYVGSAFGLSWAVINPLAQVIIYGIVFGLFYGSRPDPVYGTNSFILFLFCGLIPWQFFSQTVISSARVVTSKGDLIKKAVGFPSEILSVVNVIAELVTHLIGVALLLCMVLLYTGGIKPQVFFILIYMFLVSVFTIGIGWILSSLNVFLKDVTQVLGLLIMGLFFFTPIFYSPSRVSGKALLILEINPMFHVVDGYRLALLGGVIPPLWGFVYVAVTAFLTFAIGGMLFRKLKPAFAEVL